MNTEIKDLGLIDPTFDGSVYIMTGPLVGRLESGTVNNCYVEGGRVIAGFFFGGLVGYSNGTVSNCCAEARNVSGNDEYVGHVSGTFGGLVGYNYINGIISNCYATGNIMSTRSDGTEMKIGGLVGCNVEGTIENSYAAATVSASSAMQVGGLVGGMCSEATVSNCYSTGRVSGTAEVGGLIGYSDASTVTHCYSTGAVSGTSDVGGLLGINSGTVTDSFWDTETSGRTTSAGGTGLMTADMQTRSTFTDAGWDFTDETANGTEDIWRLCVDLTSYPMLAWQKWPLGDYYCPDGSDFKDYAVLAAQWQQAPGEPSADIVPSGGDGIVNEPDLRALCDNWLAE